MNTYGQTRTVHISRTMMLSEAATLFASVPANATLDEYHRAVVEENLLLKRTVSNREKTFRFLRELYTLDGHEPIFAALRVFWDSDPTGRPLLALLNAVYRDEVLRPSADAILAVRPGTPVGKDALAAAIASRYPERFGAKSLDKIGRNVASTWTQSGHLAGRVARRRGAPVITIGPATMALLLGWLDGLRGLALFDTLWALLVSTTESDLDAFAFAASNRDWLRYKRLGDVVEIDFAPFLARLEAPRG